MSPVNVVFRSFICLFFLLQHGFYKMKRTVFTITLECLSKYYTNLLALPIFFFIFRIAKARVSLKLDNTKHVLYQNCNFSISITTTLDVDDSPNYLNWHFSPFYAPMHGLKRNLRALNSPDYFSYILILNITEIYFSIRLISLDVWFPFLL